MKEVGQRNPHEVNVRWYRPVILAGAVLLFLSLVIYEDPSGTHLTGPLDPVEFRYRVWDGPLRAHHWAALLNTWAALGYVGAAFGLQGRIRWRGVLVALVAVAAFAAAAFAALVYLMVTDGATFPLDDSGMARILLGHAIAIAGVAALWWRLREAAKG